MKHKGNYTESNLFGTDGIRGISNEFPVRVDIILRVGQALGYLLKQSVQAKGALTDGGWSVQGVGQKKPPLGDSKLPQISTTSASLTSDRWGEQGVGQKKPPMGVVLIGKDTRLSGYMLEQALASGLNSMGVWVQLTGPLPTPGIGFLARNMRALAGIVISASHNLYPDNGIKIFDKDGFKISHRMEEEIERLVFSKELDSLIASSHRVGRSRRIDDSAGRYIVHVKNTFELKQDLEGMRIVLDCANGACYKVAPKIFEELGAELIVLGKEPDGYNINRQSGALCVEKTKQAVIKHKADVGISLDGDGDRVLMVDERGELVTGDHILGICAFNLQKRGELDEGKVVATYMSNKGLEDMLRKKGIELLRTEVGDRNVVEYMKERDICLGGESSGHIIFLKHSTTGDGCVAALNVLAVMRDTNKTLSSLRKTLVEVPQVHCTVKIQKTKLSKLSEISGYENFMEGMTKRLKDKARLYVRLSGTEPVIRVMVEGSDNSLIKKVADDIVRFLQKKL